MHTRIPHSQRRAVRLLLEHGTDETLCRRLHLDARGATFQSPWHFAPLVEMTLCIAWPHRCLGLQRIAFIGIVLDSRRIADARYETTILFLAPHEDIAPALAASRCTVPETRTRRLRRRRKNFPR